MYEEASNNSLGQVIGNLSLWNTPKEIIKIIFVDQLWLAIGLSAAFLLSFLSRVKMEGICSKFWHKQSKTLKNQIEKCWSELKDIPSK